MFILSNKIQTTTALHSNCSIPWDGFRKALPPVYERFVLAAIFFWLAPACIYPAPPHSVRLARPQAHELHADGGANPTGALWPQSAAVQRNWLPL